MTALEILQKMDEIAKAKTVGSETQFFSSVGLDDETVRWGCMNVLAWLGNQSLASEVRPVKLNPSVKVDVDCIKLLEAASFLHEFLEMKEGYLGFSQDVTREQKEEILNWIRQKNQPYTHFTPRTKKPLS